jgi:hypothetical protein
MRTDPFFTSHIIEMSSVPSAYTSDSSIAEEESLASIPPIPHVDSNDHSLSHIHDADMYANESWASEQVVPTIPDDSIQTDSSVRASMQYLSGHSEEDAYDESRFEEEPSVTSQEVAGGHYSSEQYSSIEVSSENILPVSQQSMQSTQKEWQHLGILDPTAVPSDMNAADAFSRIEKLPQLRTLLVRLKQKPIHTSIPPTPSQIQPTSIQSIKAHATPPGPIPTATIRSLIARAHSAPTPSTPAHYANQPELLPVPPPPRPIKLSRIEQLQMEWQRRQLIGSDINKEHADAQVPTFPNAIAPFDPTTPSMAVRFPHASKPLQLATAKLKMNAALTSMHTHKFESAYRLPQNDSEIDFGQDAIGALQRDGNNAFTLHPISANRSQRHRCRLPADMHVDEWLDPILNHLERKRLSALDDASAIQYENDLRVYHRQLVHQHPLHIQHQLIQSANHALTCRPGAV